MDIINKYFEGILFEHVDTKTGFEVYAACVNTMTMSNKKPYIFLFIPCQLNLPSKGYINQFPWKNIQTRSVNNGQGYNLRSQRWVYGKYLIDPQFLLKERTQKDSTYTGAMPCEINLLHDPKKDSKYQYPGKIALSSALNTFQCSITLTGETMDFELL
jgi:hypothetical protein